MDNVDSSPSLTQAWASLERGGWLAGRCADHRQRLRTVAQLVSSPGSTVLYRYGDMPDGVYGLVSGSVDLLLPRADGEGVVFHRADSGFWVGDLALFAKQYRLVTLQTASPSLLVRLPQGPLAKLVTAHPELIADFYELSHRNFATTLRLLGNVTVSGATNRVAMRLLMQMDAKDEDEGWVALSQDALAELVALSSQSVRRSIRRLEQAGFIQAGYGRIRILDRAGLAATCGYVRQSDS